MKQHVENALYGVLDYAAYPLGMLLMAPAILHRLGAADYGLWMVAASIVSAGAIAASGFSDAGLQRVARLRGESGSLAGAVGAMFVVHLVLGLLVSAVVWVLAGRIALHVSASQTVTVQESLFCVRVAALMVFVRTLETVAVAVQRGCELYRGATQISLAVRFVTLGAALLLAWMGKRADGILLASLWILVVGTGLQFVVAWRLTGALAWTEQEAWHFLRNGFWMWLQAVGSVVFRQLDRILLGVALGAASVAGYALCVQLAEPLFGLTAAGLSFSFPYLARRTGAMRMEELRRVLARVFAANFLMVALGAAALLLLGEVFLRHWVGAAVARGSVWMLPWIVVGAACSGLSVTGTYAMQAIGHFHVVASMSLACRGGLLLWMLWLLHHDGVHGLVVARLLFGASSLLVYVPLLMLLRVGAWSQGLEEVAR